MTTMTRTISRTALLTASLLALSMALGACGVKPSQVEPPPGAEENHFPATYPDPATDPR